MRAAVFNFTQIVKALLDAGAKPDLQDKVSSLLKHTFLFMDMSFCILSFIIRESVDSLCRDGAGPPIVHVHWKSF